MEFTLRLAPLFLLVATTLAQYEGYESFEGHGFDGYQIKHQIANHLEEHDHHGDEYELDYHAHPKYSFDYSVKDPHTGDDKQHWETRDGDKVKGTYTLTETDGTKRVVEYEADDKNGFNAVVHKIGTPKEEHHEEYKLAKPVYEQVHYQPEYHQQHYDEGGFIPVVGGFDHDH